MKKNILVIGGTGLVGSSITRLIKKRNDSFIVFIGSRNTNSTQNNTLKIDVNNPVTFDGIAINNIHLVVLCTNDKANNILKYCIENEIDYIDIAKPTPDLETAYHFAKSKSINSLIVFSSGWMGGIASYLVFWAEPLKSAIDNVKLLVYYSINDLAGDSSANFLAENVAKPFKTYRANKPVLVKHFLNSSNHDFSFGFGKRQVYNFDTPDLFILNRTEGIPTVEVKTTYSSKFITLLLNVLQSIHIFEIMPLTIRKLMFRANGKGDQTLFDLIIATKNNSKQISIQDLSGQAHLTALSTVFHIETMMHTQQKNGICLSHQLHKSSSLYDLLNSTKGININITTKTK